MDHITMEARLAAAPVNRVLFGKGAYHALTFGWLMSGLARSVTGKGMRALIREELAEPLNTDGLHLGRPPVESPTKPAQIIIPQGTVRNAVLGVVVPRLAALERSAGLGALYFPEMFSVVQGDTPFLDGEIPAANGTATARGLAKMYAPLACGGKVDGRQFLSAELTAGLIGVPNLQPDRNVLFPLAFHLGYHSIPIPGLMPGFGHAGLGGSLGWADPSTGMSFGFVHNRLLTPFVVADQAGFVATAALIRRGAAAAHRRGYRPVPKFGAPFAPEPRPVAG
jgi:CubicO group peptidase (beta-lactamase class C family)